MATEEIQQEVKTETASDWLKDEQLTENQAEKPNVHPTEQLPIHPAEKPTEQPDKHPAEQLTYLLSTEHSIQCGVISDTVTSQNELKDHSDSQVDDDDDECVINIIPQQEWIGEKINDKEVKQESPVPSSHEEPETKESSDIQTTFEKVEFQDKSPDGVLTQCVGHEARLQIPELRKSNPVPKKRPCKRKKGKLKRCPICRKFFSSRKGCLEYHIKKSHSKSPEASSVLQRLKRKFQIKSSETSGSILHCHMKKSRTNGVQLSANVTSDTEITSGVQQGKAIANKTNMTEEASKCIFCNEYFSRERELMRHMKSHFSEKPFECPVCKRKFGLVGTLVRHTRIHTGEKPFGCRICGSVFSFQKALRSHMKIHTGEKAFSCRVCDKKFRQSGTLALHMRTHTGEKPYQCSVCGLTFTVHASLVYHGRKHSGEKPYECSICGMKFSHKGVLNGHARTHSEARPYICEICGFRFKSKSNLAKHIPTHSEEKPYGCSFCEKMFRQKTSCTDHEKICKSKEKDNMDTMDSNRTLKVVEKPSDSLNSLIGEERVTSKGHLTRTEQHVERNYQCDICNKKFTLKSSLHRHLRIHSRTKSDQSEEDYRCSICEHTFTAKGNYTLHMLKHSDKNHAKQDERRYGCSVCGRQFLTKGTLAGHIPTHSEERPFACTFCDKRFKNKYKRNGHEKKIHSGEKPAVWM